MTTRSKVLHPNRLNTVLGHIIRLTDQGRHSPHRRTLAPGLSVVCSPSSADDLALEVAPSVLNCDSEDEEEILLVGPLDSLLPGQRLHLQLPVGHFLVRSFELMLRSAARWKGSPPTLGVVGMDQHTGSMLEHGTLAEVRDPPGPPPPGQRLEAGQDPSALTFGPEGPILAVGGLLVAEPNLNSSASFGKTVLLLVRHDAEFTQALIVNKPSSQIERHQFMAELKYAKRKVDSAIAPLLDDSSQKQDVSAHLQVLLDLLHLPNVELRNGGDVGMLELHVLHPFPNIKNAILVLEGSSEMCSPHLYSNNDNIQEVYARARDSVGTQAKLLVFYGYAGWRPGQLDAEITRRGSWGLSTAIAEEVLRPEEATTFWHRVWRRCTHEKIRIIELAGTSRRFRRLEEPKDTSEEDPDGWGLLKARVTWLVDDELADSSWEGEQHQATVTKGNSAESVVQASRSVQQMAREITELVRIWEARVRTQGFERAPGQLDWIKRSLGPMPAPEQKPNALAFWAAGLLNPSPALAVSSEIRAMVLNEQSTLGRLELVRKAFKVSIEALGGSDEARAMSRFEAEHGI